MDTVKSADGTDIAFDRVGSGPPLVFVVGAFCDRATPKSIAELLGSQFTVFTYDRRGRGASGDSPPYAVAHEIEDLAAVIDATGGPAFVFGHSSGAILALEAAAEGLRMRKLAAYEPPFIVDDTRSRPDRLEARVTALVAAGRTSDAMKLFLAEGPQVPDAVVAAMETSPGWAPMEALAHTLPYDLAICGDMSMPADRLATIAIPTLAISGGASPDWARNTVDAVAAAIPGARHTSLPGQTHGAADDVLAPVLVEFFLG